MSNRLHTSHKPLSVADIQEQESPIAINAAINNIALVDYCIDYLKRASAILKSLNHKSDDEVLHTYRTSLRRVFSVLKLLVEDKGIRKEIKPLLSVTNELRELDVMIQAFIRESTPHNVLQLKAYRKKCFNSQLPPQKRKRMSRTLKVLTTKCAEEILKNVSKHPGSYYVEKVSQLYTESEQRYLTLKPSDNSKKFHQLRIAFKECRYSFEMLNRVHLIDDTDRESESKRLQDALGEVQDVSNQMMAIKKLERKLKLKGCKKMILKRKKRLNSLKRNTLS
ncbi:CHAD domain-containing protein [Pseudomonadota bacterium]